jgi:hypothetical protein
LAVIYQYYKKEIDSNKILVRINPSNWEGLELLISETGEIVRNKRSFDSSIYEDLEFDEFKESNALEFNLYLSGITK